MRAPADALEAEAKAGWEVTEAGYDGTDFVVTFEREGRAMTEQTIRTQMLLGEGALARSAGQPWRCSVSAAWAAGAEALARAGVGALTLVDEDTVSESNLNRQCCALHSTIGQSKAAVMAARVHDIDPTIAVDARTERLRRRRGSGFSTRSMITSPIALISCPARWI